MNREVEIQNLLRRQSVVKLNIKNTVNRNVYKLGGKVFFGQTEFIKRLTDKSIGRNPKTEKFFRIYK